MKKLLSLLPICLILASSMLIVGCGGGPGSASTPSADEQAAQEAEDAADEAEAEAAGDYDVVDEEEE